MTARGWLPQGGLHLRRGSREGPRMRGRVLQVGETKKTKPEPEP